MYDFTKKYGPWAVVTAAKESKIRLILLRI